VNVDIEGVRIISIRRIQVALVVARARLALERGSRPKIEWVCTGRKTDRVHILDDEPVERQMGGFYVKEAVGEQRSLDVHRIRSFPGPTKSSCGIQENERLSGPAIRARPLNPWCPGGTRTPKPAFDQAFLMIKFA
jgi:hypothetical protein